MSATIITPDFQHKPKRVFSIAEDLREGSPLSCAFAGGKDRKPELFSADIMSDIMEQVSALEELYSISCRTQFSVKPHPVHKGLAQAKGLFFLDDGEEHPATSPFMVLRAEHRRQADEYDNVFPVFSLTDGHRINYHTMIAGRDYFDEISPHIGKKLEAAFSIKATGLETNLPEGDFSL